MMVQNGPENENVAEKILLIEDKWWKFSKFDER